MARQVASGELIAQSEDDLAEFYTLADSRFVAAGLDWYEVSNWAKPGSEAKHNLGYWRGDNWWGVGPGAHSHIGGVRWWNVKHPGTYANKLRRGEAPLADLEELTPENQLVELLMLGMRTREGVRVADLTELGFDITSREIQTLESEGLVTISEIPEGRIWVPESRRLLADWVVRRMING